MSELTAKEKIAAYKKAYYQANKDKIAVRDKLYYENNKEKVAARVKLYHENNKEKVAARVKLYYENNKEKAAANAKQYRENNKDKIFTYHKNYHIENPIKGFAKKSLRRIEKAVGKDRINRAENQLAYTQKQFIAHIESLWVDGMSWDNRSEWHIDHIKPISLFIKEGITDAKIINALSNLQPLWAYDNLSKGAKYEATSKDSCQ